MLKLDHRRICCEYPLPTPDRTWLAFLHFCVSWGDEFQIKSLKCSQDICGHGRIESSISSRKDPQTMYMYYMVTKADFMPHHLGRVFLVVGI